MDGLGQEADEYHPAGGPAADTEHITLRLPDPLEVEQDLSWTLAAAVGRRHPCRRLQPPQPARIRPHRCAASLSSSASRSSRSSSSAALSYDNSKDRPATIARNLEQAACNSAPANTAESRSKSRITRASDARAWARSPSLSCRGIAPHPGVQPLHTTQSTTTTTIQQTNKHQQLAPPHTQYAHEYRAPAPTQTTPATQPAGRAGAAGPRAACAWEADPALAGAAAAGLAHRARWVARQETGHPHNRASMRTRETSTSRARRAPA